MEPFEFAQLLELSLRRQLEVSGTLPSLQPLLLCLQTFQLKFIANLTIAAGINVDIDSYPEVDASRLLGSDLVWQKQAEQLAAANMSTEDLIALWGIYTALDKSAQFYRQASSNSAHPSTRIYFDSVAEIKSMVRRRVDRVLRSMYNQLWGQLGFAPFVLGKE